jgi:hypothetical protein
MSRDVICFVFVFSDVCCIVSFMMVPVVLVGVQMTERAFIQMCICASVCLHFICVYSCICMNEYICACVAFRVSGVQWNVCASIHNLFLSMISFSSFSSIDMSIYMQARGEEVGGEKRESEGVKGEKRKEGDKTEKGRRAKKRVRRQEVREVKVREGRTKEKKRW